MPGPSTCTPCGLNSNSLEASVNIAASLCDNGYGRLDNVCSQCLPATYSVVAPSGFRTCVALGVNAGSLAGSSQSSDCLCNAGYTLESNSCQACAAGKYKFAIGADACLDCLVHSHSPTASIAATDCLCNVGFTGANGGTCNACGVRTYKNQPGPAECSSCPQNADSPEQSTAVTACVCNAGYSGVDGSECLAGTYRSLNSASRECALCSENSNSPLVSTSSLACLCNSGYTRLDGALCSACVAGTYKINAGSADCANCVAGKHSAAIAATSNVCINCVAGNFSTTIDASGITTCQDCAAGTFAAGDAGHTVCTLCAVDTFSTETAGTSVSVCQLCSNTQVSTPGQTQCTTCENGKYKAANSVICNVCLQKNYCAGGRAIQCDANSQTVPANRVDAGEPRDCQCNTGYAHRTEGERGTDSEAFDNVCHACEQGFFSEEINSIQCSKCGAGYSSTIEASSSEDNCAICTVHTF